MAKRKGLSFKNFPRTTNQHDRYHAIPEPEIPQDLTHIDLPGRTLLAAGIEKGFKAPDEIEPGVLMKGRVHSIYGASGSGKTMFMLYLVKACLARGQTVVIFDMENGPRLVSERLSDLHVDTSTVDDLLHYYPWPSMSLTKDATSTYESLLDKVKPALVIFDAWINFLATAGLDENAASDIARWATKYTHPARQRGIAVLLLDHVPKGGSGPRGSSRKTDEVDVQWSLHADKPFDRETLGRLVLRREKDREGWLPPTASFTAGGDRDNLVFRRSAEVVENKDRADGSSNPLGNRSKRLHVLEALREFGSAGATDKEWKESSERRKVSKTTFYREKKFLLDTEQVYQVGDKFYIVT